jgi:hypothetical protein
MAFLDAVERHGLDWVKRAWDFEICPKDIAKKALKHAGCNFDAIWALNARISHNPHTGRDELTITWLTVAYYLEKKGVITLRNAAEAKKRVEAYYNA